jgi:hypothetical protein
MGDGDGPPPPSGVESTRGHDRMTLRTVTIAALLVATGIAAPPRLSARGCVAGCRGQLRACLAVNRATAIACRRACRDAAVGVGACRAEGKARFVSGKSACATSRGDCLDECSPPPSVPCGTVLDTCGRQLLACARGVVAEGKACVRGCAGSDRLPCLEACAATVRTDAAACGSTFDDCIAPCRAPTTTALPGGECGADAAGSCGGACPAGATCEAVDPAGPCGCVSGLGGPCGGNLLAPPPTCAPGLVCQQSNPDVTGTCVAETCIPLFASGCAETADCCLPCTTLGRAPCAVCLGGQCVGTP